MAWTYSTTVTKIWYWSSSSAPTSTPTAPTSRAMREVDSPINSPGSDQDEHGTAMPLGDRRYGQDSRDHGPRAARLGDRATRGGRQPERGPRVAVRIRRGNRPALWEL